MTFHFGVYPGGATGDDAGSIVTGPPDDPTKILAALADLRVHRVRGYAPFRDRSSEPATATPPTIDRFVGDGRALDIVAQFLSPAGDVDGFVAFVEALILRYGASIATLQIGEEPNVTGNPTLDGDYPRVAEAVIAGVIAAKRSARTHRLDIAIGTNTTVLFGPATAYYTQLVAAGGPTFVESLDYIGIDIFPDVFRPVDGDVGAATAWLLEHHRTAALAPAGLANLPLYVTENGWPTGPGRSDERQAAVLGSIVEAVAGARERLGLAGYTLFSLRDADSSGGLFGGFGILRDDYTPKPAYARYRDLIRRFADV